MLTLFRSWGPSCWCWRRHSRCTSRRSWCPPWRTGGQGAASPGAACWRSWPGRRDWTSLSSRSQRFSLTNIIVWSLLSSPPRTLHPSLASSLFLTEIQSKSEKCWVIDWRLPSDLSVSLLCLFTQGWVWRLTWMARLYNIHWLLIVDLWRITEFSRTGHTQKLLRALSSWLTWRCCKDLCIYLCTIIITILYPAYK